MMTRSELRPNPLDGVQDPLVTRGEKAMNRQQQERGIGVLVVVRGDEALARLVEAAGAELRMQLVRRSLPARLERLVTEERRQLRPAPKREPAHEL